MTGPSARPRGEDVLVERTGAVLRITINRPASLNAVTADMLTVAAEAVEAAGRDTGVRVIVLTGAGRAFSSGADLTGTGQGTAPGATLDAANRLTTALRTVPKPVLAAVNGLAAGVGCSFALAADLTVARESAFFLLAFANAGLMPDGGATALLPAAIGHARAARMAMLAERIPAPQAAEWGLIAFAVPDDEFDDQVQRLTTRLAEGPTAAFAQTKHAFNTTVLDRLPQALEAEREGQNALFHSADFAEGVTAFRTKRPPAFEGR
ncbi:enoyl-CoA hydratase-related protein [Prauserella cavernicola]|uniref:Enoyl-CoA hydratase/isomerase family protein n=1 Tax=Prauserella cavernicola TaxID=2800127 RepID=A0A934V2S5_9PSEU|nr:enoyl-CoA hydratase-related protein [Prauserella cavernicola]MBK1782754.1 enoyl-CoA hydratase/isomerase family protein [Prauserella cavernicola]